MREYQDLLRLVLEKGRPRSDRTGTGTLSVFGAQARFDLRDGRATRMPAIQGILSAPVKEEGGKVFVDAGAL